MSTFASENSPFSLYDTLVARFGKRLNAQLQRKATLRVLSHALEDAVIHNKLAPVIFTAFQKSEYYENEAPRYTLLKQTARSITLYGKGIPNSTAELELDWFVVVNEPRFKALLVSRELPQEQGQSEKMRSFVGAWSYDHEIVDYAAHFLAQRFEIGNPVVTQTVQEVLAAPHEPLEQVRYIRAVGDFILAELEHSSHQTIYQINRNHQLLEDSERQEQALNQLNRAVEIAQAERDLLKQELKRIYIELTRSQQLMTDTFVEKARLEQQQGLSLALLEQLEATIEQFTDPQAALPLHTLLKTLRQAILGPVKFNPK